MFNSPPTQKPLNIFYTYHMDPHYTEKFLDSSARKIISTGSMVFIQFAPQDVYTLSAALFFLAIVLWNSAIACCTISSYQISSYSSSLVNSRSAHNSSSSTNSCPTLITIFLKWPKPFTCIRMSRDTMSLYSFVDVTASFWRTKVLGSGASFGSSTPCSPPWLEATNVTELVFGSVAEYSIGDSMMDSVTEVFKVDMVIFLWWIYRVGVEISSTESFLWWMLTNRGEY